MASPRGWDLLHLADQVGVLNFSSATARLLLANIRAITQRARGASQTAALGNVASRLLRCGRGGGCAHFPVLNQEIQRVSVLLEADGEGVL
jgi:hypothetical protein